MNAASVKLVYLIRPGAGGLPRMELTAPDGARAEIYLQGAHVTSWKPAGGHERLFLSPRSEFCPGAPIRGGIPVVFPQFGTSAPPASSAPLGTSVPLPLHGFARLMTWEFTRAEAVPGETGPKAQAVFRLRDTEDTREVWPHAFLAELCVTVGGCRLEVALGVTNTGAQPFRFTAALHTYLRTFFLSEARVEGLRGLGYRDAADGGLDKPEEDPAVRFTGEVNRIYPAAPAQAVLAEPGHRTLILKQGFSDTVVWNPGVLKCAAMPDLDPEAYRRFACVEAASAVVPVQLNPRERWQGAQTLTAAD